MRLGPDISRVAAAIGDPARANMLVALMSGQALTSSELAFEAGIGAATASVHLNRLAEAGLVRLAKQGRHRYWALADAEVAQVLEILMGLAARSGPARVRPGPKEPALRKARVCYDHLAGDYGVRLYNSLLRKGVLIEADGGLCLGPSAPAFIEDMGLQLSPSSRPMCRICLDWSARTSHLAGHVGAGMLDNLFRKGWVRRDSGSRVVHFTADGERRFLELTRIEDAA